MISGLVDKKEAISALERIYDNCEEIDAHLPDGDPDKSGYKMFQDYITLWKFLSSLPSTCMTIENMPSEELNCTDCIQHGGDWECDHMSCHKGKPERNTGKWIRKSADDAYWFECEKCGARPLLNAWHKGEELSEFCPNCGCRMLRGKEE